MRAALKVVTHILGLMNTSKKLFPIEGHSQRGRSLVGRRIKEVKIRGAPSLNQETLRLRRVCLDLQEANQLNQELSTVKL